MAQQPLQMDDWRVQRYINWLCTPPKDREPRLKKELAEELGFHHNRFSEWEKNPNFLKEWEKTYLRTIGDPGVKLRIMKTLEKTATDADDPKHVAAAKTYFEIEGSMKPAKMEVQVTKETEKLSDAELDAMLNAHAQSERERRDSAKQ